MGSLTLSSIVSEGLLIAGDSSLTTRATVALKAWLRSQYAGFLWPFCRRELASVALASGVSSLTFGNGSGGVTEQIHRIGDPIRLYDSAYRTLQNIRVVTDWGDDLTTDPDLVSSASNRGAPTRARVIHATDLPGKWYVKFDYSADQAYLLKLSYHIIPTDPASGDYPLYPNDRTMMQAVICEALKYKKHQTYRAELEILVSMVNEDRLKYGSGPGINDVIGLDTRIFR